jgi:hypothetical protein
MLQYQYHSFFLSRDSKKNLFHIGAKGRKCTETENRFSHPEPAPGTEKQNYTGKNKTFPANMLTLILTASKPFSNSLLRAKKSHYYPSTALWGERGCFLCNLRLA